MTDIPHLKFLPDGSYDLSTPERRLAAAESLLANIATLGPLTTGEASKNAIVDEAGRMADRLREAREQETARAAIGVEELELTADQVRHVLWIEDLLLDSDAPLTAAAALTVLGTWTSTGDGGFSREMLITKITRLATRAVRIDTSSARPIHTVDNLTDEQIKAVLKSSPCDSQLESDCCIALGEDDDHRSESEIVEARERIAAALNDRRLLAVVAQ